MQRTVSYYPRGAGKTTKVRQELDRQLAQVQARRSSLEGKYSAIDRRRLREFMGGGITEETLEQHVEIEKQMEVAYRKHMALLEQREKYK